MGGAVPSQGSTTEEDTLSFTIYDVERINTDGVHINYDVVYKFHVVVYTFYFAFRVYSYVLAKRRARMRRFEEKILPLPAERTSTMIVLLQT